MMNELLMVVEQLTQGYRPKNLVGESKINPVKMSEVDILMLCKNGLSVVLHDDVNQSSTTIIIHDDHQS